MIRHKLRRLAGRALANLYMRIVWRRFQSHAVYLPDGSMARPIGVEKLLTDEGWIFILNCSEMDMMDRFRRIHKIDVRDIKWKNGSYVQVKSS